MARPDTSNAHVREGARQKPDKLAADAERLVNDPAFLRAYNAVRDELVRRIESFQPSFGEGTSHENDAYERELCRSLRTLSRLRTAIGGAPMLQLLREAGFRPKQPEKDDD